MKNATLVTALAVAAIAAVAGLAYLTSQPLSRERPLPPELVEIALPQSRSLTPFRLQDSEMQPFDLARLKGQWSLLFFGYTHCPDICPTTLTTMRVMAKRLQQTPGVYRDTQFVFVSVDPKRDSPAQLKEYVRYFHPDFLAATGEKTQIDKLARQVGAVYMFDGDTDGNDYIVNHSAAIAVIDPQGRWVARFNPPHKATKMADDFRRLRDHLSE